MKKKLLLPARGLLLVGTGLFYFLIFKPQVSSFTHLYAEESIIYEMEGCTTILVGKDATAGGSVILGHNEDMGTLSGRLRLQKILYPQRGKFAAKFYDVRNVLDRFPIDVFSTYAAVVENTLILWDQDNKKAVTECLSNFTYEKCLEALKIVKEILPSIE